MKRGGELEKLVKDSCDIQGILCQRLKDGSSKTRSDGSIIRLKTSNPADMILYNDKIMLYLECKSYTTSVPFADLRQLSHQLDMKVEFYNYDKFKLGFIVEFKKYNKTIYLSCEEIRELQKTTDKKSFNYEDVKNIGVEIEYYKPPRKRKLRIDIIAMMREIGG